jgi:hypothetical protein
LLTSAELTTLCGPDAELPAGATTYDWGHGVVYLRPELYPSL